MSVEVISAELSMFDDEETGASYGSVAFAGLNSGTRGSMDTTLSSDISACSIAGTVSIVNELYNLILPLVVIGGIIVLRRRNY